MSIENYILSNLKNMNYNELLNEIKNSKSEEALPGLGVLFKIYFNALDESNKESVIKKILAQI